MTETAILRAELDAVTRLSDLNVRLLGCRDVTTALEEVLDAAIEITDAQMGNVRLLTEQSDALEIVAQRGFDEDFLKRFRSVTFDLGSACARVLASRERVVVEDIRRDPAFAKHRDVIEAAGCRALQSTPLLSRSGELLGVLSTHYTKAHRPSDRDLRVLDLYCCQAAEVIERTRREEALRQREAHLAAALADTMLLQDISRELIEQDDVNSLYQRIVETAVDMVDADCGTMQVRDEATGELCLIAAVNMPPQVWDRFGRVPWSARTSCGEALRRGERAVVDYVDDAGFAETEEAEAHLDIGIRCALSTPLIARSGTLVGMLTMHWKEPHRPTERQQRLLDILARQAADAAERMVADAALREGRERLKVALEAGRLGDWDLDLTTGKARTSFRHDQCFGATEPFKDWNYETFLSYVHPDDRAEVKRRFDDAVASAGDWHFESRVVWKDGSVHWVEAHGMHHRDASGKPHRMIGVVHEITERKEAEAEIRRRVEEAEEGRRILQGIMEHVPEGITVADAPDVNIRMVSRHGVELVGRPEESITQLPDKTHPEAWGIFHTDGETLAEPDELPLTRAVRSGEVVINEQWLLRRPDGSDITILCNAGPIQNKDGAIVGGVIAWRDISELRAAQQALKDADRRKDEFLATLGHELRNPLAAIRMATRLLQRGGKPERLSEMADVVDRQSAQLVRLIDDLLDVSRITRGKIGLRRRRIELGPIVAQAIEGSRPMCESNDVSVTADVPREPIFVHADAARLGQVIGNLLHNACKYTPRGGNARVVVSRGGDEAVIRVQDTGEGIAPDQLGRLFQMFSQIDPVRDRAKGGLGIGLALSKRLVELHGGTIEARSDGPGTGSEFTIRLPIAPSTEDGADARRPEVAVRSPVQVPSTTRRRVLAVDDNLDALLALTEHLRASGHEVVAAQNGEQALREAETHRPHVLLLDIGLPGLDGYEVARRIREQPWGRDVKIIAVSGWGQDEDKRRAAEAGIDAHLTKPADEDVIEREVVESKRAE